MYEDYINGFVERTRDGYAGRITIEGINLGEIVATYFKKENETFLWLRRMKILEYDDMSQSYVERDARPKWECYLKKQVDDNVVAFKGEFNFMRFRFSIAGVWDSVLGMDKHRLNLYVERMEKKQQRIINNINERKKNEQKR